MEPIVQTRAYSPLSRHPHHAPTQGISHGLQAALEIEVVDISEGSLHTCTDPIVDRIASHSRDRDLGVRDDIEPADVKQISIIPAAFGDEVAHDSHQPCAVHRKVWTRAIPKAPWVENG